MLLCPIFIFLRVVYKFVINDLEFFSDPKNKFHRQYHYTTLFTDSNLYSSTYFSTFGGSRYLLVDRFCDLNHR